MNDPTAAAIPSSPLKVGVFRALWIATIVSNIGTWMNDIGAGWLMTSLTPSPFMVALVQAATTLPMAVLSLPGGALADIVDRRRLLLAAQAWAMLSATILFLVTVTGLTSAPLLLLMVFATACGAALSAPAFQAITSEIVPRPLVPQAVALGSLGTNIARAIGPALGGLVIAAAGPAWVFLANALSVVGVITVLARWQRTPVDNHFPPEHLPQAIRVGFRFARSSPELRAVLVRAVGFFLCASALWSLMPLLARRSLGLGPTGYGLLLAFIGAGAIAGAFSLPILRRRLSPNRISVIASLVFAGAMAALSQAGGLASAAPCSFVAGIGWIWMMANFNGAAQLSAPAWVKARALGAFLFVFQGSMTIGAALWGTVASFVGPPLAILIASGLLVAGLVLAARFRLVMDADRDLTPSRHWPTPMLDQVIDDDEGPVLVTIEYHIDPARSAEFVAQLRSLRMIRLRDGAMRWNYWRDTADSGRIMESFVVPSWLEHLRQHERVTNADKILQEEVGALHIGEKPPIVRHFLAIRP